MHVHYHELVSWEREVEDNTLACGLKVGYLLRWFLVYSWVLHQLHWLQAIESKRKTELQSPEIIGKKITFNVSC
jgi:hypothetical protein